MNHVTLETAKALKKGGFPQPEPEVGQFWYSGSGVVNVCRYIWRSTRGFFSTPPRFVGLGYSDPLLGTLSISESFFAPTATDILRQLGGNYELSFLDGYFFLAKDRGAATKGDNPAELLAAEWLKLNHK